MGSQRDVYPDIPTLLAHRAENRDYRLRFRNRKSWATIVSPHGGYIEEGTSALARAIAGSSYNLFDFQGLQLERPYQLHVTSTRFRHPVLMKMLEQSEIAVSIHGMGDEDDMTIWLGGLNIELKNRIHKNLLKAGFSVNADSPRHRGISPQNFVNLAKQRGVQLELPDNLLASMFVGRRKFNPAGPARETTPRFAHFVTAIRSAVKEHKRTTPVNKAQQFADLLSTLFRANPWHGISPGERAPDVVRAFIEVVPTGAVKLELDKQSGYLSVDRPQQFSSMCPTLYGLIPQTYCGQSVAELCAERTGQRRIRGDGDPLDICVLTEKDFAHGDVLVHARPIGGLRMIDRGEADDKIIAVLDQDIAYGNITDISSLPEGVVARIQHYFLSYKQPPGTNCRKPVVSIKAVYGRDEAVEVIRRSLADYNDKFGRPEDRLDALRSLLAEALMLPAGRKRR
ncbi:MAG TPA: inorganic pyrophosphatase [Candidatus Obscuribacterales bacterium]